MRFMIDRRDQKMTNVTALSIFKINILKVYRLVFLKKPPNQRNKSCMKLFNHIIVLFVVCIGYLLCRKNEIFVIIFRTQFLPPGFQPRFFHYQKSCIKHLVSWFEYENWEGPKDSKSQLVTILFEVELTFHCSSYWLLSCKFSVDRFSPAQSFPILIVVILYVTIHFSWAETSKKDYLGTDLSQRSNTFSCKAKRWFSFGLCQSIGFYIQEIPEM